MQRRTLGILSELMQGHSPDGVGEAASRVLESDAFANSKRLQRFLAYVVEQTMAGRQAELKEYDLALAVFDRDSSFDPRVDSIVRVEARRVRQQLAAYYRETGHSDSLIISLPKGGYVPVFEKRNGDAPKLQERPRRTIPGWVLASAGLLLVLGAAAALWMSRVIPGSRVPHHWHMQGSRLTILDDAGRICWEKQFSTLAPENDAHTVDRVLVADIDNDERPEVLFNHRPENIAATGGSLMCFDWRGRLRWEFRYGRRMTFGNRTFDPSYGGRFFRLLKSSGRTYLLTIANHYLWYPAQAALLDPKTGRLLEEYWHPGSIYHVATQDLDGDGSAELLLGAINNPGDGLGHAALAVLKIPFSSVPPRTPAASEPFPSLTGGGEAGYWLFPLPDVCRVMGKLPIISRFLIDQNRRILVQTPLVDDGGIVYYLDFDLKLLEYRLSDNFTALHERYYRQNLLDHRLTARETALLGRLAGFASAPDGNSAGLQRFWH